MKVKCFLMSYGCHISHVLWFMSPCLEAVAPAPLGQIRKQIQKSKTHSTPGPWSSAIHWPSHGRPGWWDHWWAQPETASRQLTTSPIVGRHWRAWQMCLDALKGWCTWHTTWLEMMMLGRVSQMYQIASYPTLELGYCVVRCEWLNKKEIRI